MRVKTFPLQPTRTRLHLVVQISVPRNASDMRDQVAALHTKLQVAGEWLDDDARVSVVDARLAA